MTAAIDHGPTDSPLLEETIGVNLERTVERFGDREAFVVAHQGIRQTWAEFDATVDEVAKGLMAMGIEAGDRVAMWSPNYAEWTYIQYATAKIGAIQVNVNPAYRTNELEYALHQSGAKLLVTRTEYLTSTYRDMVDAVSPHLPDLERVVYFDTDDWATLLHSGDHVSDPDLAARAASLSPGAHAGDAPRTWRKARAAISQTTSVEIRYSQKRSITRLMVQWMTLCKARSATKAQADTTNTLSTWPVTYIIRQST